MISKFVEALAEGMLFYRNNANKEKTYGFWPSICGFRSIRTGRWSKRATKPIATCC